MRKDFTHYLPYCGVLAAITCVMTFVNFTVPAGVGKGTLVHLGAAMVVVTAYVMPALYGGLSVAAGMCLYDILCGWAPWAPFTFVIRFAQVYILTKFIDKNNNFMTIIGYLISLIIDVGGYYLAECIIYANFVIPLASIPAELTLNAVGVALGIPVAKLILRSNKHLK